MAWGRRCDLGCEDWPDSKEFRTCPACGEPTSRFSNLSPISTEDADSFQKHVNFEAFYETRCIALGIEMDGPLPDDYVVAEAT